MAEILEKVSSSAETRSGGWQTPCIRSAAVIDVPSVFCNLASSSTAGLGQGGEPLQICCVAPHVVSMEGEGVRVLPPILLFPCCDRVGVRGVEDEVLSGCICVSECSSDGGLKGGCCCALAVVVCKRELASDDARSTLSRSPFTSAWL